MTRRRVGRGRWRQSQRARARRAGRHSLLVVAGLATALPLVAASAWGADLPAAAATRPVARAAPCVAPTPLTAAAGAAAPGVTANRVTVGTIATLSGPTNAQTTGAPIGVRAYFATVNARGGVHGRTLEVDARNDAFNATKNAAQTQAAAAQDFALVGSFSLVDGGGCAALGADAALADVPVAQDPATPALPNEFSVQPLSPGAPLGPLSYFRRHFPKDTRVGTIVAAVPSTEAQWAGQEAALQHAGFSVGYVRQITPLESDFSPDVTAMRRDHVTAVDLSEVSWQDAADFMQNAAAQHWHPGLVFSDGSAYAAGFVAHAGGAAADGIQIAQAQALYLGQDAAGLPADRTFLAAVHKVAPHATPDLAMLYGWASAALFVQALRAAGAHPTRGALLAQLRTVTHFDAGGLLAPANPARNLPSGCTVLLQVSGAKFVRVQPTGTGFDCSGRYFNAPAGS